jgi:hypothetical protein
VKQQAKRNTKEKRVTKPAAHHDTPVPQSRTVERDPAEPKPIDDTPELQFLRDEIEALLSSPTVLRGAPAPSVPNADDHAAIAPEDLAKELLERATESGPSPSEAEPGSDGERITQPSIDVQLLREAARK